MQDICKFVFVAMEKLFLKKLSLVNFKNYTHADINFCKRLNCITGNNGEGKTNLLDAIYYLSFTKSYFNSIDSQNIGHDANMFVIQGNFSNGKEDEVYIAQKRGDRKQIKLNKKEVTRFADYIGMFPAVMASPSDIELILDGSEARRKFVDSIISQYDKEYLNDVILYIKVLLQRNAQLKQFSKWGRFDAHSLKIWDEQMIAIGNKIHKKRKEFSIQFASIFQKYYELISGGKEPVEFTYQSQLNKDDFEALLNQAHEKDRNMEHSTVGIHKDDWEFSMDKRPVKRFASQGQQKSYLLAIKFAQFEFLKQHKQVIPILMLDDIHDKLDEYRVRRLIEIVSLDDFRQVFITNTDKERLQKLLKGISAEQKTFKVHAGIISEN
jgi:DNA replication and repair protein RecF